MVLLADARAGIAPVDLAGRIPVAGRQRAVFHQDRAEGDGEENVVLLDKGPHLFRRRLLQAVPEDKVSRLRHKHRVRAVVFLVHAGIGVLGEAVELPVVDHDAEVSEHVEVRVHRDHGVHAGRDRGGKELSRRAEGVVHQFAAELAPVRDLDLAAGDGVAVDELLPDDRQDRLVVIITDFRVRLKIQVRAEDRVLAFQEAGVSRLLNHFHHLRGVVRHHAPEVGFLRLRRDGLALRDGVVLRDIGDVAEGVGLRVVESRVQARDQIRVPEAAGGLGRSAGIRVDILQGPGQHDERDRGENQADQPESELFPDALLLRSAGLPFRSGRPYRFGFFLLPGFLLFLSFLSRLPLFGRLRFLFGEGRFV